MNTALTTYLVRTTGAPARVIKSAFEIRTRMDFDSPLNEFVASMREAAGHFSAMRAEAHRCVACGDVIDYCSGHGEIGDPEGFRTVLNHVDGEHGECHPYGCDDLS